MRAPGDTPSSDERRFRALYEADYHRILGYVLRRTADREDAADIVADTFALAWSKLPAVPEGDEATLWLYGVARRLLSNHRRKAHSRGEVVRMLMRDYEDMVWLDPSPAGMRPDSSLARAWEALSPADRDLLGLLLWETLSVEQIAAVVGCSRSVAKVRIHRARRRFARELECHGYPLKPATLRRHVQAGRAEALPDKEAM